MNNNFTICTSVCLELASIFCEYGIPNELYVSMQLESKTTCKKGLVRNYSRKINLGHESSLRNIATKCGICKICIDLSSNVQRNASVITKYECVYHTRRIMTEGTL